MIVVIVGTETVRGSVRDFLSKILITMGKWTKGFSVNVPDYYEEGMEGFSVNDPDYYEEGIQ